MKGADLEDGRYLVLGILIMGWMGRRGAIRRNEPLKGCICLGPWEAFQLPGLAGTKGKRMARQVCLKR